MSVDSEIAPILTRRFAGGAHLIPGLVDDLLEVDMLRRLPRPPSSDTIELLSLALSEVLHTITDVCGQQTDADASHIELWLEPSFAIVSVRFRGAPMPDWLLANWDRAQEPAVLAPASDSGWGWLVVREALDGVSHDWSGSAQLIFLEKRF